MKKEKQFVKWFIIGENGVMMEECMHSAWSIDRIHAYAQSKFYKKYNSLIRRSYVAKTVEYDYIAYLEGRNFFTLFEYRGL